MIRILVFVVLVFLLGLGFAWLADRPGDMVVTFGGYQYQVSLMVAAVAVVAVVAGVMILWWLTKAIWTSPYMIARYFRVRQRDRGYQALSTGMIAAGAGDGALARKMNKQASKLIRSDQEPLIMLLDAQASLLEGDHDGARQKFEAMLDDPEMRLLGLRGLYLEAERLGDRDAARHYAGRAADIAPQLGWAAESTLEEKTARGDWDGALKIIDARKANRQPDRDAIARSRAVLLTGKAMASFDTDVSGSKAAALEANRLRPDFVPAAIIAAKAVFRQGDVRKGAKILEAAWRADPHPEVADLYVHARHGDAVGDRLARARKLKSLKQNHAESEVAVSRAALDAGEYATARAAAAAAIRMNPREGVYLLMADIEEAETGDEGKVRQWLARAVRAPRDPAWVADGYVSEHWAPASPISGRLDAFEWRVPMERLGQLIEQDDVMDAPRGKALASLAPPESPVEDQAEVHHTTTEIAPEPPAPMQAASAEAIELAPEPVEEPAKPALEAGATAVAAKPAIDEPQPTALPHLPDDPGVDPDAAEPVRQRFRLF